MNKVSTASGLALFAALAGVSANAQAEECLKLPNPVVISGSTAVKAVVGQLAAKLSALSGNDQMTLIFAGSGSCSGVSTIAADSDPTAACTATTCATTQPVYWQAGQPTTPTNCDLPAGSVGLHVDLALSDVFAKSCAGVDVSGLDDSSLLVIPFEFIVPTGSSQTAIDAREAYYAYGLGAAGKVTPWINKDFLFQRDDKSGSQITVFTNIHLKATAAEGTAEAKTGDVINAVGGATDPEAAIGFASSDAVDAARASVKGLAYRHWGQDKYYWADSDPSGTDKQNVRDGHYPLWGYEHGITRKDATGDAHSRAATVIKYLSSEQPLPAAAGNIVDIESKTYVVPMCAMQVTREIDGGDFKVRTGEMCTCAFLEAAAPGTSGCKTCKSDNACGTGESCTYGYCEKN